MAESNQAAQPAAAQVPLQQAVIRHAQNDMASIGPDTAATAEPPSTPEPPGGKIGEGALSAMVRMGFKELAQVLPAFPDSIRPVEEPGAFGNVTPQIATEQMGYSPMPDSANRAQFQSQDNDRAR